MIALPKIETVLVPSCFIFTVACNASGAWGQIFVLGRHLGFADIDLVSGVLRALHSNTAPALDAFTICSRCLYFMALLPNLLSFGILFLCTSQMIWCIYTVTEQFLQLFSSRHPPLLSLMTPIHRRLLPNWRKYKRLQASEKWALSLSRSNGFIAS